MQIDITKEELYSIIKSAVREVIGEKEISHILHSLPEISDEEMNDISQNYGSPDKHEDIAFSETVDL